MFGVLKDIQYASLLGLKMFKEITPYVKISVAISSIIIASFALMITLSIANHPTYSDFIVGHLTWNASNKLQDLIAVPIFIFTAFVSVIFLGSISEEQNKISENNYSTEFSNHLLLWSLPTLASFSQLLLNAKSDISWIYVSVVGILFISITLKVSNSRNLNVNPKDISLNILAIFFIALIPLEIVLILTRGSISFIESGELNHLSFLRISYAIAVFGLLTSLIYAIRKPRKLIKKLPVLFLIGQIGLSFLYLTLYPARISLPENTLLKYQTTIWLKSLILGMIAWAIIDVINRYKKATDNPDFNGIFSPIAIFSLIIGWKFGQTIAPSISPDDYHFGEGLLGWWSYIHGKIPYVDYIPAHGLIGDDLTGLMSNIFYDGSAGSFIQASNLSFSFLSFLAFISLYRFIGRLNIPFLAIFFLGSSLLLNWLFLTPFLCLWFSRSLAKHPSIWLATWITTIPIIILGVPAQGLVLILASLPMAIYYAWYFLFHSEKKHWQPIIISSAILTFFLLLTPIGLMLSGAIQYVLSNASVNQVAYGVPWSISWSWGDSSKGIILELIRMSWIVTPIFALGIMSFSYKRNSRRKEVFLPALVVFLFCFLMIPYSMGRIDPGGISRPGAVASFALSILLPLIAWRLTNERRQILFILLVTCLSASLNLTSLSPDNFYSAFNPIIQVPPLQNGLSVGLENIGIASAQDDHWNRLIRLSKVINEKLDRNATYLDLTSRNAQYFYLNRIPPIPVTAPYNMTLVSQQKEAVSRLIKDPPKIALLEGENVTHDGGGLALRNPYLYRYVMDNYIPEFKDGFIIGNRLTDTDKNVDRDSLDISLKSITSEDWLDGIHRSEVAIVIDNPHISTYIEVGDNFQFWDGSVHKVINKNPEISALWFDGDRLTPDLSPNISTVKWLSSSTKIKEYQLELLQKSFAQSDLQRIPIAWGKSSKSLTDKMSLIKDIDEKQSKVNDLQLTKSGSYKIQGNDPYLIFDLSSPKMLSGKDAGLLKFKFSCQDKVSEPRIQVFWRGSNAHNFSESYSLRFTADDGILIVPLDASPRWLKLNAIKELRLDVDNSSACSEIYIQDVTLQQRTFN